MKKTRLLALLIAILMVFSAVVACNKNEDNGTFTVTYSSAAAFSGFTHQNPVTFTEKQLPLPLAPASLENHDFAGWFTAETEGTEVQNITTAENTTVFARFNPHKVGRIRVAASTTEITNPLQGGPSQPFNVPLANDGEVTLGFTTESAVTGQTPANTDLTFSLASRSGSNYTAITEDANIEIVSQTVSTVKIKSKEVTLGGTAYIIIASVDGGARSYIQVNVAKGIILVNKIAFMRDGVELAPAGTPAMARTKLPAGLTADIFIEALPFDADNRDVEVTKESGNATFVYDAYNGVLKVTMPGAEAVGAKSVFKLKSKDEAGCEARIEVETEALVAVTGLSVPVNTATKTEELSADSQEVRDGTNLGELSNGFMASNNLPVEYSADADANVNYNIRTVVGTNWDLYRGRINVALDRDAGNIIHNSNTYLYHNFALVPITVTPAAANFKNIAAKYFDAYNGNELDEGDRSVLFSFDHPNAEGEVATSFEGIKKGTTYVFIHSISNPNVGIWVKIVVEGVATGITDEMFANWDTERENNYAEAGRPDTPLTSDWLQFGLGGVTGAEGQTGRRLRAQEWRASLLQGYQDARSIAGAWENGRPAHLGQQISHFGGGNVLNVERRLTTSVNPKMPYLSMWSIGVIPAGDTNLSFLVDMSTNDRGGHREYYNDKGSSFYNTLMGLSARVRIINRNDLSQSHLIVPMRELYHDTGYTNPPTAQNATSVSHANLPDWIRDGGGTEIIILIEVFAATPTNNNVEFQLRNIRFTRAQAPT